MSIRYYDAKTNGFYDESSAPKGSKKIEPGLYAELINGQGNQYKIAPDASGNPVLVVQKLPTTIQLCIQIDSAADSARLKVAGDPLRAIEYERAAVEAQAFKDAGYPAESVPRTVAAWAINGRTAEQAADSILAEAAAYAEALYCLREVRLNGKEQVRAAMDAGNVELAQQITEQTIAKINTDIAGVGNN